MDKDYGLFSYAQVKKNKILQLLVSDERKQCPFNFSQRLQCSVCKHSICLISENELQRLQKKGHADIRDKVHVCSSKLSAVMNLLKIRKSVVKTKKVRNAEKDLAKTETPEKNKKAEQQEE